MQRHLNVFVPYERPPNHEDQLTRAAMIVVRAVPLARDALLARVGLPPSARLPDVDVDMQVGDVAPVARESDELVAIRELVSVFLSPDESLDLSGAVIEERDRGQRLDGVVRFTPEAVVVIESKIVGGAPTTQAHELRIGNVPVERSRVVALRWEDLLADWASLLERELVSPAERVLVQDLMDFAQQHFPALVPLATLARWGDSEVGLRRRLAHLLRAATGIDELHRSTSDSAVVKLDESIGTVSTQRLALGRHGDTLRLWTWPAELRPQAQALYRSERVQGLRRLVGTDGWSVRPNLYLGYRFASTAAQRLYTTCTLDVEAYLARWTGDDFDWVGSHPPDTVRGRLWPWLRERGYATAEDEAQLDDFLDGLGRRDAHLRPGVAVSRSWPWSEATEMDEQGSLTVEIRRATNTVLAALDEPTLPDPPPA